MDVVFDLVFPFVQQRNEMHLALAVKSQIVLTLITMKAEKDNGNRCRQS